MAVFIVIRFTPSMSMYRWTRLSTQSLEEDWYARLSFIDPEHLVMLTQPESTSLKIQVFSDKKTADHLVKNFGGKVTLLKKDAWAHDSIPPRAPLAIRDRLKIHSDEATWKASPKPENAIFIPAGMAFGTGDHATTATCLRLLCDLVPELPTGWRAMDAGTGTGILAIAAEKLGASSIEAFDFDPVCIRVSKENAQANNCGKIDFTTADSRKVGGFKSAHVILANLFSELLIASAPGLAKKLLSGGHLIFSGVLRSQAEEVCRGLEASGFKKPRLVSRGKWCAGITSLVVRARR